MYFFFFFKYTNSVIIATGIVNECYNGINQVSNKGTFSQRFFQGRIQIGALVILYQDKTGLGKQVMTSLEHLT